MNCYCFDDIQSGQKESFEVHITEKKMNMFQEISGDINPLHNDRLFALSKGFLGKVVYGHLTISFFSTLAGVYLPGRNCLIQEVSYKFVKPIFVEDTIIVYGEVVDKDDRTRQIVLKVRIYRKDDDELLVRGKMIVGII